MAKQTPSFEKMIAARGGKGKGAMPAKGGGKKMPMPAKGGMARGKAPMMVRDTDRDGN